MGSDVTSLHTVVIIIMFVKIYISKVQSITFIFIFLCVFFFSFKILPMFQWTMYTAPPGRSKLGLCSSGWLLDPLALVLKSITCEFSDRAKLTDQIFWGRLHLNVPDALFIPVPKLFCWKTHNLSHVYEKMQKCYCPWVEQLVFWLKVLIFEFYGLFFLQSPALPAELQNTPRKTFLPDSC